MQFSPLGAGSVGFAVTDLPGVLEILRVRCPPPPPPPPPRTRACPLFAKTEVLSVCAGACMVKTCSCSYKQERIQKVLAKDMIEPKRKFTDMTRVWDKLRAKKSGGPGGLLCLTVVQARELRCLCCPVA